MFGVVVGVLIIVGFVVCFLWYWVMIVFVFVLMVFNVFMVVLFMFEFVVVLWFFVGFLYGVYFGIGVLVVVDVMGLGNCVKGVVFILIGFIVVNVVGVLLGMFFG